MSISYKDTRIQHIRNHFLRSQLTRPGDRITACGADSKPPASKEGYFVRLINHFIARFEIRFLSIPDDNLNSDMRNSQRHHESHDTKHSTPLPRYLYLAGNYTSICFCDLTDISTLFHPGGTCNCCSYFDV